MKKQNTIKLELNEEEIHLIRISQNDYINNYFNENFNTESFNEEYYNNLYKLLEYIEEKDNELEIINELEEEGDR